MKKLFFTTLLCLLFNNSFAGTLIHQSSTSRYEIKAECLNQLCDEYEIKLLITSPNRFDLEKTAFLKNDKAYIENVRKSVCNKNINTVLSENGFAMVGIGPLAASWTRAFSRTKSPILRGAEQVCAYASGVAFNVVAFPYFAARGVMDLREAIVSNRDFSEALNILLLTGETREIGDEVNHLVVNSFFYRL